MVAPVVVERAYATCRGTCLARVMAARRISTSIWTWRRNPFGRQVKRPLDQQAWTSAVSTAHTPMGLAGAGIKSARDGLRSKLSPFASLVLETDAYIAWLGAHQAENGGIVILGTGSCGLAVIGGRRVAVGGYGAEVSDE